ncbi:MAG: CapA family protein [Firmicutes bacterium]|nr:CapA family protein [Bacillota bacterium]
MSKTTYIATGDSFITRRIPAGGYDGYQPMAELIKSHDVAFNNLEMTFHDREGVPAAVSGGTWAMADPRILDDIKAMGFNLFNTANNHSCDYSHGGVLATIRHLKERDMIFSGTGKDLGDASKPCYFEAGGQRVALISVCASFDVSAMAGEQSADMQGRPGLNPLRWKYIYHLDQPHFDAIVETARVTRINAERERDIAAGYFNPPAEGTTVLGSFSFVLDDHNWIESVPDERDMTRIEAEIREAAKQADVVLVSLHAHETDADDTTVPARFIETFSRRCIDAGAKVMIGHGPHEVRGIELYHGGVIFYSLGNFIFQTETVEYQPADAYSNKGVPLTTKVGEYMDIRSKNSTVGYIAMKEIWEAIAASWTIEDGSIKEVRLYPVGLGFGARRPQGGWPVLSQDEEFLQRLAVLCKPYGTELKIENGCATLVLS